MFTLFHYSKTNDHRNPSKFVFRNSLLFMLTVGAQLFLRK